MLLRELQALLGRIYDIRIEHDIYEFLVTDRRQLKPAAQRASHDDTDEELLVSQVGDDLCMSLFLDRALLERLSHSDPMRELNGGNLADYWTALEGVSHFQYMTEAENFFGKGAKGIAEVIQKAFKDQGEPNAFIAGEEAGGAVGVGVRYGKGTLKEYGGGSRTVYWQGPSIGFDIGGNAAKTFILIYNLKDQQTLFQRFPGVEGSLYFVGGAGLNYARTDGVTVAPVRLGVGWRQGASVSYIHFTEQKSLNPF